MIWKERDILSREQQAFTLNAFGVVLVLVFVTIITKMMVVVTYLIMVIQVGRVVIMLNCMRQAECLKPDNRSCKHKLERECGFALRHAGVSRMLLCSVQARGEPIGGVMSLRRNRPGFDLVELAPDAVIAVPVALSGPF